MCRECDLSAAHKVYLCVTCRVVWKYHPYMGLGSTVCTRCGMRAVDMGFRWRAPKLSNKKAWALIDSGDFLWDKRAITRKAEKKREKRLDFGRADRLALRARIAELRARRRG